MACDSNGNLTADEVAVEILDLIADGDCEEACIGTGFRGLCPADVKQVLMAFQKRTKALEAIVADEVPCVCGCRPSGDHNGCTIRFARKTLEE